jgi:hypothetical protein
LGEILLQWAKPVHEPPEFEKLHLRRGFLARQQVLGGRLPESACFSQHFHPRGLMRMLSIYFEHRLMKWVAVRQVVAA